ncbi:Zn(II)2Cys6 transcription factor [Aspergillus clavatus NRRL 1]|uniref:C6 transcription factor, putative n=1 Tax=Aspergillus clavatus (strain ATCC 1007 / CBS 513.65 / DSM 816 / NCTC 3887 / NRRL 1 / QM 1276 / 107) TaxID=344612 RepID=A1CU08_ASPCL|nr:C6 transcription factor, putative [Aspergillus clavatus NRRL 1]EAW06795.1 C6 transcription factor, putative [Aspergillus clavatus NRRL 1]
MDGSFIPTKNPSIPKGSGPSLLACLLCRHKHLKCDGTTPVCGRCAATGAECQYTPSRRGYKGPSKKRRANPSSPEQLPLSEPSTSSFDPQSVALLDPPADWSLQNGSFQNAFPYFSPNGFPSSDSDSSHINTDRALTSQQPTRVSNGGPLTPESLTSVAGDGYLVDIYYTYFHPSHPILPPLRLLYRFHVPRYLEHVIKFIGSHFTPAANSEVYRPSVMLSAMEQDASVEKLQALLLLAIVLHSRNERAEAGECLVMAVDLAFELGIHRETFAVAMGGGDPVREESLRRTWWELFVIEGMLTALGVQRINRTSLVPPEVPLPCEERIFQDGLAAPAPPTIAQFDERVFADEERDFSSYTYRIEAVRILGRVVAIQDMIEGQQDHVEAIDARIASWFHHLPESKSELLRPDGSVDEMMFQATMIVNGAGIYLHFPRSDLLSSPAVAAEVICGHHGPCSIPAFSHHAHAMKAVKAASEISTLAAIRMPVVKHTPFFICALVLSSIVQLAACSVKAGQMPDPSRDRLTLTIGVFKSLARTWAISQTIMRQIKAVARDVMDVGLRPTMEQLDLTTVLDGGRFWLPDALPR